MPNKAVLAIDIDDVIAANAAGFIEFSNKRWGTHLTIHDYDEHWGNMWQIHQDEVHKRAIEYHESGTIGRFDTIPNAEKILRKLHERFVIVAVTSRRIMVEPETRAWLETHYSGIVDEVRFAGFYDDSSKLGQGWAKTKADILDAIKAKYFIDDQLKHCLAAANTGMNVILFGDYAWNQTEDLPKNITRCSAWEDVEAYFETESALGQNAIAADTCN